MANTSGRQSEDQSPCRTRRLACHLRCKSRWKVDRKLYVPLPDRTPGGEDIAEQVKRIRHENRALFARLIDGEKRRRFQDKLFGAQHESEGGLLSIFERVRRLDGGFNAWVKSGLPVERHGEAEVSPPR